MTPSSSTAATKGNHIRNFVQRSTPFAPSNVAKNALMVNKADSSVANHEETCPKCAGNHYLFRCSDFINHSPRHRYGLAKQLRVCLNCLRPSHSATSCTSSRKCRHCSQPHHSLLHFYNNRKSDPSAPAADLQNSGVWSSAPTVAYANDAPSSSAADVDTRVILTNSHSRSTLLLSTVALEAQSRFGSYQRCRTLCDSGSQSSFIAERCFRRLGPVRSKASTCLTGLSPTAIPSCLGITTCTICPVGYDPAFSLELIILENICSHLLDLLLGV